MSEHTAGPWKMHPGTYENGTQMKVTPVNPNESMYAMVGGGRNPIANARLIAAAPDLLDFVWELIDYIHACEDLGQIPTEQANAIREEARAAIAKAKGET